MTRLTVLHIIGDMKCVLDTDVIVASLRSRTGASYEIIRLLGRGEIDVYASVALLLEYESVLKRPEHRSVMQLNEQEEDVWLDGLVSLLKPITPHFFWRPLLRDPGDEMVLEAAINAQADYIVTFNRRHFRLGASRFGVKIVTPAEFLRKVRA